MNISRVVNVMALGLGLFSVGCIGVAEERGADAISELDKETLDVGPGGGPNGLSPNTFHADKIALTAAMDLRLTNADNFTVSAAVANTGIFLNGDATFSYAVGCALDTTSFVQRFGLDYYGYHFMTSGTNWWDEGLSASARKDILKCMITRLNPYGATVDIMLKGQNVKAKVGNYNDFTFPEAKWTVTGGSASTYAFHVWPSSSLGQKCLNALVKALESRVCGSTAGGTCNLTIETDSTLCTDSNNDGAYTCNGEDAVETFLRVDDVELLYPRCLN